MDCAGLRSGFNEDYVGYGHTSCTHITMAVDCCMNTYRFCLSPLFVCIIAMVKISPIPQALGATAIAWVVACLFLLLRRLPLAQGLASPSAAPPAISLDNLSCSHDGGDVWQLKDVSYVLQRGAKVGLTGRNGCGKVMMHFDRKILFLRMDTRYSMVVSRILLMIP